MVAPLPNVRGSFAACSGCSLCLLVCPVWRRTRDLRFTPELVQIATPDKPETGVPMPDTPVDVTFTPGPITIDLSPKIYTFPPSQRPGVLSVPRQ